MNLNPLVSILIPVYNREAIIEETIQSALYQTYKNIEIVVTDNYSTDKTWTILNKWAEKDNRIRIFQNEANLGPIKNWLRCIKEARGEYSKILWSDDLIAPAFVEKCMEVFDKDTAFVMTGLKVFEGERTVFEDQYGNQEISSEDYLNDILLFNKNRYPVSPGNALFRTQDLLDAYTEEIENNEGIEFKSTGAGTDLLFFLKTAIKYPKIRTIEGILALYRWHKDSITISRNDEIMNIYQFTTSEFIRESYPNYINQIKTNLYNCEQKHERLVNSKTIKLALKIIALKKRIFK